MGLGTGCDNLATERSAARRLAVLGKSAPLTVPAAPVLNSITNFRTDGSLLISLTLPPGPVTQIWLNAGGHFAGPYAPSATIVAPFADVGGQVGNTPAFTVSAVNAAGEGPLSNTVSMLVTYPKPQTPTVVDDGSGGNLVQWDSADGNLGSLVNAYGGAANPATNLVSGGIPVGMAAYDDSTAANGPWYSIGASLGDGTPIGVRSDSVQGPN